jgi:hypothetical protein
MDANHQIIAAQAPAVVANYDYTLVKGSGYLPANPADPTPPAPPMCHLEVLTESWRRLTGIIAGNAAFDFIIHQHRKHWTRPPGANHLRTDLYASGVDAVTGLNVVVFDRTCYGKYAMFRINSAQPNLELEVIIKLMPIAQ